MQKIRAIKCFAVFAVFLSFTSASCADQKSIEFAISTVKEFCLVGTQYDVKADIEGNLSFLKKLPGLSGSASVNVRSSPGAAAILDEKIRLFADTQVRDCMKPYIGKIVDAILSTEETPRPRAIPMGPSSPVKTVINDAQPKLTDTEPKKPSPQKSTVLSREIVLQRIIDARQPPLLFVVGQDSISTTSIRYLQALVEKLRPYPELQIQLIPVISRSAPTGKGEPKPNEISFARQIKVRDALVKAGFMSEFIVLIKDRSYANSQNEIYDDAGSSLEAGIEIELIRQGR